MMTLLPGHQTNNHVNVFVFKLCTNGTSLLVQLHPVLLAMICLSGYCWIRFKLLQTIDPSFRLFSCTMDHFSKWWWFMQCNLQFNDFVPIRLCSTVHIVHSEQHKINLNICTSESSSSSESSDTVVAWGFLFSDFFLSFFWVGGLGVLFLKVLQ